jgi:ribonuclease-3
MLPHRSASVFQWLRQRVREGSKKNRCQGFRSPSPVKNRFFWLGWADWVRLPSLHDHMPPDRHLSQPTDLAECERRIGYTFRNRGLLEAAVTHASGAVNRLASNERLEFLGDAILGFVVCEKLYARFPDSLEGDLTRIKSVVVSRETCSRISEELGLVEFLVVGKGLMVDSVVPTSVLSDLFESLVAAVYLDGGMEPARRLIERYMAQEIVNVAAGTRGLNHKSLLQQVSQRDFGITPTYSVVNEEGPDHNKTFQVLAQIGDHTYPPAWGRNKKEAEQRAAAHALAKLGHSHQAITSTGVVDSGDNDDD